MKSKIVAAAFCAATLSACQTNYAYEPIVPNPVHIEMAQARCQMMSSSAEQGYIAFGSPSYVAGASLGNAIGNAIRVDQFMQQCMTLSGWRRVPTKLQKQPKISQPKYTPSGKPYKRGGAFPPAPANS